MYLATGLHKAAGPQWWNGEAIWRAVALPQLAQFDLTWLSSIPLLPMAIGWATLAVEIGYCILVWHGRTRFLAVASIVGMHLGIAAVLGLNSFAFLMIALNVAAFLVPTKYAARPVCGRNHRYFVHRTQHLRNHAKIAIVSSTKNRRTSAIPRSKQVFARVPEGDCFGAIGSTWRSHYKTLLT